MSSENTTDGKSEEAKVEADPYLPRCLERHLPANLTVRDAIMGVIWIAVSGLLGILIISLFIPWVGVVVMSIGTAHFTWHYWVRTWSRYNQQSEKSAIAVDSR